MACLGAPWCQRWGQQTGAESADTATLVSLNGDPRYELSDALNIYLGNDIETNPYLAKDIKSSFTDFNEFSKLYKNSKTPIILSLNIQSLNSKFNELKTLLLLLSNQKTNVVAIALQEIWQIPHADVLNIPNFTFVYKQRTINRGGGVAFFIHNDYSFKILDEHTIMHEKFFKCIAIEVVVNKKKFAPLKRLVNVEKK